MVSQFDGRLQSQYHVGLTDARFPISGCCFAVSEKITCLSGDGTNFAAWKQDLFITVDGITATLGRCVA